MGKTFYKIPLVFLCLILLFSNYCTGQIQMDSLTLSKKIHDTAFSHHTQYLKMTRKQFRKLNLNFCDTFSLVFTCFYPIIDTLMNAENERVYLHHILLSKGFTMVNWGRGNWENGPRFIDEEFKKDSCHCTVYKIYFNYHKQKNGYYNLKVKEKIFCNEKDPTWLGE